MPHPDPVLPLPWRDHEQDVPVRRGPKQQVSLDAVLDAAIELADAEGLTAPSMRWLAQRVGLGAMSLSTYVPGRGELVVLMVDHMLGRSDRPPHEEDARRRIESVAESAYEELRTHPWLLDTSDLRAWLGPNATDRYEWQRSAVDGLGLSDVEMDQTVTLLDGIAATALRAHHAVVAAERRSGLTELDWWNANADAVATLIGDRKLPLASRVGHAAGEFYQAALDPDRQFQFALDRVIDGLLDKKQPAARTTTADEATD